MEKEMKLYSLITDLDDETFRMRVSERLNNGWQLYGKPTLTFDGNTPIAAQAVGKEVEGEGFNQHINLRSY